MTAKWLVRGSSSSIAAGFDYWGTLLAEHWSDLEETLRRGHPAENLYAWIEHQPAVEHDFQAWMIATARLVADEIVAKIPVPAAARRVLDIGGGHGIYSIALCRRYPALAATVLDSPAALQTARATIAAEQMAERVGVQEGNFLLDDLGTGYDVALLFNIVHGFTPEQNTALLCNVAKALNPGGLVVIAEQLAGKSPGVVAPAIAQILGMSYFQLLGGRIYTFDEIAGWLTAAGFGKLGRKNLRKAPGNSLIVGYKAG
jgi:cyclopropane fatty-acyl-phospholipid synthase-like methyltransferase